MRNFPLRSAWGAIAMAVGLSLVAPVRAGSNINYPIVFTSPLDLAKVGMQIRGAGEADGKSSVKPFKTLCYDHGGQSLAYAPISISDALLARYRAKGFTRETLCMALVSQARFDPETGKRLPTYVFRDDAAVSEALASDAGDMADDPDIVPKIFRNKQALRDAIANFNVGAYDRLSIAETRALVTRTNPFSEEQPLAVPACFKNGTPFIDCNWRFGLKQGKKFSPDKTRFIRDIGAAIDRQMKDAVAHRNLLPPKPGDREPYLERVGNFQGIRDGIYEGQPESVRVPEALMNQEESIAWYDIDPVLPRGYGYALYARQPADPAFSLEALEPSRNSSRFDPERILKAILEDE